MYVYTGYMKKTGKTEARTDVRVAYSLQETAAASGKTFSAVYQQVRAGNIPTGRMGRRHLVPASYFVQHGLSLPSTDKDNA
jgi:hypothetical protein